MHLTQAVDCFVSVCPPSPLSLSHFFFDLSLCLDERGVYVVQLPYVSMLLPWPADPVPMPEEHVVAMLRMLLRHELTCRRNEKKRQKEDKEEHIRAQPEVASHKEKEEDEDKSAHKKSTADDVLAEIEVIDPEVFAFKRSTEEVSATLDKLQRSSQPIKVRRLSAAAAAAAAATVERHEASLSNPCGELTF